LAQSNDSLVILHWGDWKLDSLGVDFPITENSLKALEDSFGKSDINDITLSSLMSRFELLSGGEKFDKIFEIIPKILDSVNYRNS